MLQGIQLSNKLFEIKTLAEIIPEELLSAYLKNEADLQFTQLFSSSFFFSVSLLMLTQSPFFSPFRTRIDTEQRKSDSSEKHI